MSKGAFHESVPEQRRHDGHPRCGAHPFAYCHRPGNEFFFTADCSEEEGVRATGTSPPVVPEKPRIHTEGGMADGGSYLVAMCAGDDPEKVRDVLKAGVDPNSLNSMGRSALNIAADHGNLEIVQLLLDDGAKVDLRSWGFSTALFSATGAEHAQIMKLLIARGADVNAQDEQQYRPLHLAARKSRECVEILISAGAEVNCLESHGYSPLHYAAVSGKRDIVEFLIDSGANVNLTSDNNYTVLMATVDQDGLGKEMTLEMINLLLSKGANPNIRNSGDMTAYDIATQRHFDDAAALLKY